MRLNEAVKLPTMLLKYGVLSAAICFFAHFPLTAHAITEQQQILKDRISEIGLQAALVEVVKAWKEYFPFVDPLTYDSGETWTATDAAAWKDSVHWFIHSDAEEPDLIDFLKTKFEYHCVALEGFYGDNNITVRYHLFNANQIPIFGFKLDSNACNEYDSSK